jgi:hypothetical protein
MTDIPPTANQGSPGAPYYGLMIVALIGLAAWPFYVLEFSKNWSQFSPPYQAGIMLLLVLSAGLLIHLILPLAEWLLTPRSPKPGDGEKPWENGPKPDIQRTQADLATGNTYRLEFTKHLLTLAAGVLAFTTTFGPKFSTLHDAFALILSWITLGTSILTGSASLYYWEQFYISYHKDYKALFKFHAVVGEGPLDANKANHVSARDRAREDLGRADAIRNVYKTILPPLRYVQIYLFMVGMTFLIWFATQNLAYLSSAQS